MRDVVMYGRGVLSGSLYSVRSVRVRIGIGKGLAAKSRKEEIVVNRINLFGKDGSMIIPWDILKSDPQMCVARFHGPGNEELTAVIILNQTAEEQSMTLKYVKNQIAANAASSTKDNDADGMYGKQQGRV